MDEVDLVAKYNAAVANGKLMEARRISRVIDAMDRALNGTLETVEFDWKSR